MLLDRTAYGVIGSTTPFEQTLTLNLGHGKAVRDLNGHTQIDYESAVEARGQTN